MSASQLPLPGIDESSALIMPMPVDSAASAPMKSDWNNQPFESEPAAFYGEGSSWSAYEGYSSRWRAERADLRNIPPDVADLLEGRLAFGGKMILSAPSKADKSWLAINLAETIAVGGKLLGVQARKGRVLYVNLEVRRAKFYRRLLAVAEARGYNLDEVSANLDVINMRGFYRGPEEFERIVMSEAYSMEDVAGEPYACIVVDPLYKLNFDENKAQDVGKVCEAIDHLAEEFDAAIIQVHHHSKGPKHERAAIDRASGSGVLGRDPDCILDILEVFPPSGEECAYGDEIRGFIFEWSLRDYKTPPNQRVLYKWPIHMLDVEGVTANWEPVGVGSSREAARAKAKVARAEGEAAFANAQLNLVSAFIERGIHAEEGMSAKEAAEITGMTSRGITNAIDRFGSDLFSYGRKPGKKPGTLTKENFIFMKVRLPSLS
ncbi:MAG: AAA family ATPase [Eggerthellaceae bacterium]|nr:AAA family ATPase [Eggerthellaceae bacterium]